MTNFLFQGLAKALEYAGDTHTVADVLNMVVQGEAQMWVSETEDACIVTEVHIYPRKKVLHFWLAAGELEPVVKLSRDVLAWGQGIGCDGATLSGRRGWQRVLKAEGWSSLNLVHMGREV